MNQIDELIVNKEENIEVKYLIQKSNLPIKVDWLKNDKSLIIDNNKYSVTSNEEENSYSLSVSSCDVKDAGKYTISVSNSFGKTISNFRLLIRCN